jgi:hypothetical protein
MLQLNGGTNNGELNKNSKAELNKLKRTPAIVLLTCTLAFTACTPDQLLAGATNVITSIFGKSFTEATSTATSNATATNDFKLDYNNQTIAPVITLVWVTNTGIQTGAFLPGSINNSGDGSATIIVVDQKTININGGNTGTEKQNGKPSNNIDGAGYPIAAPETSPFDSGKLSNKGIALPSQSAGAKNSTNQGTGTGVVPSESPSLFNF